MGTVRVAIVGVGNCASSLVQGVRYYADAHPGDDVPGLAQRSIGGTNTLFVTIESDGVDQGIDRLFERIHARAKVIMPLKDQFYGMREFGVEDPDGYILFFAQRIG